MLWKKSRSEKRVERKFWPSLSNDQNQWIVITIESKKKIFKIELFFQTHRHKWKSFVSIDSWLLYTQCKFIHLIKMMLNYYESWNKRQQKTKKIFNTFSHRSWFLCLNFIDFDLTLIHLSPLLIFSFSLAKPKGRNEMKKNQITQFTW